MIGAAISPSSPRAELSLAGSQLSTSHVSSPSSHSSTTCGARCGPDHLHDRRAHPLALRAARASPLTAEQVKRHYGANYVSSHQATAEKGVTVLVILLVLILLLALGGGIFISKFLFLLLLLLLLLFILRERF